jgi:tRNA A37 methylthiotransferase MiaB
MKGEHSAVLETDQPAVHDQKASVYIETLACERRLLDAQKIRTYFTKNNYDVVDNPKEAQFIVLLTCGFTNAAANVCFGSIEKYKDYDAELIVVGCIPETHGERLKEIFDGTTISAKNLERIDEVFPGNIVKFSSIKDDNMMLRNTRYRSLSQIH